MSQLTDIPAALVHVAQQAAAVRLHLWLLAEVHDALAKVGDAAQAVLRPLPGNQPVSAAASAQLQTAVSAAWDEFIKTYTNLVAFGIQQASSMPFGVLAILHAEWVMPVVGDAQESLREALNPDVMFQPQLQALIDAAYRRTWGDGLNLSNRIWQLDRYGRDGLYNAINLAIARGDGAWELAQAVEGFLLPGRDCPRWARERLRELTKADIAAGDRTGLYSGDECRGQGVSYNALRLARTEIQAALNTATTEIFRTMPWIEKEQIMLSPEHATLDECDDVVNGGEGGQGIYPVGEIFLPIHPHCLCVKLAVLMKQDQFVEQMRSWLNGGSWPQMDAYALMLGGRQNMGDDLRTTSIGVSLAYWLWSDPEALGGLFWNMVTGG